MGTTTARGRWLALAAALLGWMFDGFEMGIFPPVARPALVAVLGLAEDARVAADESASPEAREKAAKNIDSQVGPWNGAVTAAFLVGAACGGWFFGWLGDRVGRVRAMVFSVLTYAAFTGLCGLVQAAWQFAVLRFLSALGMGGEWALGVALVMESWPQRSRPLLAGLVGAAGNAGYFIAAGLVMAVGHFQKIDAGGWRWVLAGGALPALLTFFVRAFVPESEKWREAAASGPRPGLADVFTPALWRRTLIGAALGGVALIGTWGSVQWIPQWTNVLAHGDQQQSTNAQMAMALGAMVGSFAGAVVGVRLSRRWTYFALCVGSLLACAYLFRWHGEGVDAEFFVAVAVASALTASFYGWLPLYLPELFPTRVRATGQGFSYNAGRLLAAVGALSTGYLMSQGGVFHGSYAQAGATISLVYLVGLAVVWLAPETRGQPLPEDAPTPAAPAPPADAPGRWSEAPASGPPPPGAFGAGREDQLRQ
jgi:MFS family permease